MEWGADTRHVQAMRGCNGYTLQACKCAHAHDTEHAQRGRMDTNAHMYPSTRAQVPEGCVHRQILEVCQTIKADKCVDCAHHLDRGRCSSSSLCGLGACIRLNFGLAHPQEQRPVCVHACVHVCVCVCVCVCV